MQRLDISFEITQSHFRALNSATPEKKIQLNWGILINVCYPL